MLRKRRPSRSVTSSVFVVCLISVLLLFSFLNLLSITDVTASALSSPPDSITVTSANLSNGSTLAGFNVNLRINGNPVQSGFTPVTFSNLQTGIQYQVIIYWYGNYYFRHFSDGNLNRYALVTLNATAGQNSVNLTALYQYVPPSQAASLNIFAEFPNGTRIGTTLNSSGYIQHSPGMWLTVTPPGSTVPFTGSFTGGSILPFILFNNQTYTVEMSGGYKNIQFSHWKDNNNTSLSRQIKLNGNAMYTAIYVLTSTTTSTTISSTRTTSTTSTTTSTTTTTTSTTSQTSKIPEFPVGLPLVFVVVLTVVVFLLSRSKHMASPGLKK